MADEGPVRGLPAWVWAVVFLPQGIGKGFIAVALAYVLSVRGVSVAAIAAVTGL
jgi:Mrp family chromosome partitioning ATPase